MKISRETYMIALGLHYLGKKLQKDLDEVILQLESLFSETPGDISHLTDSVKSFWLNHEDLDFALQMLGVEVEKDGS